MCGALVLFSHVFLFSFSPPLQGFLLVAGMAEYIPQPPSTWPAGPQPPNASTSCPLEPVDLGVSEQQTPPEQPPSSPELGEDEEATSPPDPDVPYPDLAPVVFFCLKQTTSPRNWCIKMVCNPYPFQAASPPVSPPAPSCPVPPLSLPTRDTCQVSSEVSFICNESFCPWLAFKQNIGCCNVCSKEAAYERRDFRESC